MKISDCMGSCKGLKIADLPVMPLKPFFKMCSSHPFPTEKNKRGDLYVIWNADLSAAPQVSIYTLLRNYGSGMIQNGSGMMSTGWLWYFCLNFFSFCLSVSLRWLMMLMAQVTTCCWRTGTWLTCTASPRTAAAGRSPVRPLGCCTTTSPSPMTTAFALSPRYTPTCEYPSVFSLL